LHCSDSKRYQIAEHAGWQIVRVYKDRGISGAKQRQAAGVRRPSKAAARREFDVVTADRSIISAAAFKT